MTGRVVEVGSDDPKRLAAAIARHVTEHRSTDATIRGEVAEVLLVSDFTRDMWSVAVVPIGGGVRLAASLPCTSPVLGDPFGAETVVVQAARKLESTAVEAIAATQAIGRARITGR